MTSINDVLKASKGVYVEDTFAMLWGRKLSNDYTIDVYTGTLPAVLAGTKAGYLHRYKIYGNTEQTGTPTPENPIYPSECGERTENLLYVEPGMLDAANWILSSPYYGSVYFMYYLLSEDTADRLKRIGTIAGTVYLTASGSYYQGELLAITSEVKSNGVTTAERLLQNNGTPMQYSADVSKYSNIYLCIGYGLGITSSNKQILIDSLFDNYKIMLNAGTVPLSYEPYGYKLPLASAGQSVDIYLGEVETTRRIGKIDLGTLNWGKTASGNFWSATTIPNIRVIGNASTGNAICDMFKEVISNDVTRQPYSFSSCLNNVGRPFINKTGFEDLTVEEFKQAMSGVYMYYVLATEETGTLNEPLRKIGDYADTIDSAQTSAQIPTSAGSTTISWAGEGLAPSEVEFEYERK